MLSYESSGTAAKKSGRSTKSNGTYTVWQTIRTNALWSCVLVLFDATGPPGGDAMYQGRRKPGSGHCRNQDGGMITFSRVLRLIGRRYSYTTACSSSLFIAMNPATLGFGTVWRLCKAHFCPSTSRSQSSEILGRSRTVTGARGSGSRHAERISRLKEATFSALGSGRGYTGCAEQGVLPDEVTSDETGRVMNAILSSPIVSA